MRISRVEYENFRNFRERGEIDFATDGRVTIIYGKNGDGKTTLHQLMQWIIYGRTKFNKTATDSLFNLQFEKEQPINSDFDVWGKLYFSHAKEKYVLHRVAHYHKPLVEKTSYIGDDLELWRVTASGVQQQIDNPVAAMEMLLPSELSDYFFFDGESMIATLKIRSSDAAKSLRKSLFSMLDLNVLEMANMHIGDKDHKETILGKLYLSRADDTSSSEISIKRNNVENAQDLIEKLKNELSIAKEEKKENQDIIRTVSEQIGSSRSKVEYEKLRSSMISARDNNIRFLESYQEQFGNEVFENFSRHLISKSISDARKKLKLKVDQTNMPDGINNRLLDYLLSSNTVHCICGNPICEENRKALMKWKELLPPKSYALLYHDFAKMAENWGSNYNPESLSFLISNAAHAIKEIEDLEERIRELDDAQKKSGDISDLVTAREEAEARLTKIDENITALETELRKAEFYLKKANKEFDEVTKASKAANDANRRIEIMESVKAYFTQKLQNASVTYSEKLQKYIQNLLDKMLTADRRVAVDTNFSVRIVDSNDDESKSEGQFAVVSFAYIGGILKLIQSEESLQDKEYPLVLDGPFSKLDEIQRQNVVDTLPHFAPQVILFSKDSLETVFDPEDIGFRYTIESNAEKNIAIVREGYHWN